MFIGEYNHTLDTKGRVSIPAKFRSALKQGAVITRGIDNCLFIYPSGEWKKLAKRLSELPLSQKNTRAFSRLMLAGAMDDKLDSQGRLNIPEYLRTYAGASKNVVITGLYNRLEVWDEEKWKSYKNTTEKESENIAEQLGELGV